MSFICFLVSVPVNTTDWETWALLILYVYDNIISISAISDVFSNFYPIYPKRTILAAGKSKLHKWSKNDFRVPTSGHGWSVIPSTGY